MSDHTPPKTGQGGTPSSPIQHTLPYEDVVSIIGELYLSSHLRIRSLQTQAAPLFQSFQSQVETLKAENAELRRRIDEPRLRVAKPDPPTTVEVERP